MTVFANDYRTSQPNANVTLYTGPITMRDEFGTMTGDGTIELSWLPDLRVCFNIPDLSGFYSGNRRLTFGKWFPSIEIPGAVGTGPTIQVGVNIAPDKPVSLSGILNGTVEIGSPSALAAIETRLVNFAYFVPSVFDDVARMPTRWRQVVWETENWKIVFDPTPELATLANEAASTRGFILSHVLRVERPDQSPFTVEDAKEIIERLFRFLSFVQGRWINLVLPLGYDLDLRPVWRQWQQWLVSPWQWVPSWADLRYTGELCIAFAGFLRRCANASWRSSLDLAMFWYVESNRAFCLETSILLAQVAMERLTWEYYVRQGRMSSKEYEDRKRMNAAKRLTLLSRDLAIPLIVPPQCQEILRHWSSLADAIPAVRNSIAHPKPRFPVPTDLLIQARDCALWMLEMTLLRLIDYTGCYWDRRETSRCVGEVAPVPWSQVGEE